MLFTAMKETTFTAEGPREAVVAARAFELWQAAGSPPGRDQDFWFMAERQVNAERCSTEPAWGPVSVLGCRVT
jgi:hypothetical protein